MEFNSPVFLFVFFPAVFLLSRVIPGTKGKNILLCAAGLLFYAFGGWSCLGLLLLSAAVNYLLGLGMLRFETRRRFLMICGIVLNLLFLGVYKYLDFALGLVGLSAYAPGLAAPAGISFFTFLAIAYLVDGYREPELILTCPVDFLLYLSFFPRLLSGPLVRVSSTAEELHSREQSLENAAAGLRRFVRGLAKKLLLAETVGALVNAVFALDNTLLSLPLAWLGMIGYILQLFFDFSGYTDMAIGLGLVFGFHLPENFDFPYISRSVTEFWRRWHMTLSRWFRDYVYIPLGGNRRGQGRTVLNKFIVFFLTGLWHGAGLNFIFWGLWNGAFLMLEGFAKPLMQKLDRSVLGRALQHVYLLLAVISGFVFFRSATFAEGLGTLSRMFDFAALSTAPSALLSLRTVLNGTHFAALLAAVLLATPVAPLLSRRIPESTTKTVCSNVLTVALFLLCLAALSGGSFAPFIYFRF